jgi:hypothetical protein
MLLERMLDDDLPRWMFRNISAIRENIEPILELLDGDRLRTTASAADDT